MPYLLVLAGMGLEQGLSIRTLCRSADDNDTEYQGLAPSDPGPGRLELVELNEFGIRVPRLPGVDRNVGLRCASGMATERGLVRPCDATLGGRQTQHLPGFIREA
jgi:hypothetical protein